MAIVLLGSYQDAIDTATGAVVQAEYEQIINELNAHTAATNPHTNAVDKTGDTMSGALAIVLATNNLSLSVASASTTTTQMTITGNSLTTGGCLTVTSASTDVNGRNLVSIINDDVAAVLATCLMLKCDATMTAGAGALEIYKGASLNFYIPETGIAYAKGLVI